MGFRLPATIRPSRMFASIGLSNKVLPGVSPPLFCLESRLHRSHPKMVKLESRLHCCTQSLVSTGLVWTCSTGVFSPLFCPDFCLHRSHPIMFFRLSPPLIHHRGLPLFCLVRYSFVHLSTPDVVVCLTLGSCHCSWLYALQCPMLYLSFPLINRLHFSNNFSQNTSMNLSTIQYEHTNFQLYWFVP